MPTRPGRPTAPPKLRPTGPNPAEPIAGPAAFVPAPASRPPCLRGVSVVVPLPCGSCLPGRTERARRDSYPVGDSVPDRAAVATGTTALLARLGCPAWAAP